MEKASGKTMDTVGRSGHIFQDFKGLVGIVGIEKAHYLEFRDKIELGMGQKSRVLLKLGMARIKTCRTCGPMG